MVKRVVPAAKGIPFTGTLVSFRDRHRHHPTQEDLGL